ncbi:MAG: hypothetical protein GX601_19265, partial [Anaerolineales bacterium]|nr:hypothetical protein [Anaerolineales bacterium]
MPLLQESAEGATVHILIIAADAERADALWAPLRGMASRCTLTTSWADARATLTRDAPDIVVAERAALSSLTLEERADLTDAQRWPVTVLVDQGA